MTEMSSRELIKNKLRDNFSGKIVRKDLTKKIKEGANVPVYVLEFLLGQYCGSDDEQIIEAGVEKVKKILSDNFVRPDEAQKILSSLRQKGSYTVIDKITVEGIKAAMNDMDPELKNIIYMRYWEGKIQKEIASELNIPLGSMSRKIKIANEYIRNSVV